MHPDHALGLPDLCGAIHSLGPGFILGMCSYLPLHGHQQLRALSRALGDPCELHQPQAFLSRVEKALLGGMAGLVYAEAAHALFFTDR